MKYALILLLCSLLVTSCSREVAPESVLEVEMAAAEALSSTVISKIVFQDEPTEVVVRFIMQRVIEQHPDFQYTITIHPDFPDSTITLNLRDIPAIEALRFVTYLTDWRYQFSGSVMQISNSRHIGRQQFYYHAFHIPENLLFDAATSESDFIDARPILDKMTVLFPEGAQAVYRKSRRVLIVKNTQDQIDLVREIIEQSQK